MNQLSPKLLAMAANLRTALATCIMPYYGKLSGDQVFAKDLRRTSHGAEQDAATIADTSCEVYLARALPEHFPGARIVGEEGASTDPSLLKNLRQGSVIVVDPLDGTSIFRAGVPGFGILASVQKDGDTKAGWILRTFTNAKGEFDHEIIMAARHGPVWHSPHADQPQHFVTLLPHAQRKQVDSQPEAYRSRKYTVRERLRNPDGNPVPFETFRWKEAGSAVDYYADLALGRAQAAQLSATYPWDHAAGVFINRQLGGVDRHLDTGERYDPCRIDGGVMSASSPAMLEAAMRELFITGTGPMREPCVWDLLLPPSQAKYRAMTGKAAKFAQAGGPQ